jgi:uncharacterized surface anchored protein
LVEIAGNSVRLAAFPRQGSRMGIWERDGDTATTKVRRTAGMLACLLSVLLIGCILAAPAGATQSVIGSAAGPVHSRASESFGDTAVPQASNFALPPALSGSTNGSNGQTLIFGDGDDSDGLPNPREPLEELRTVLTHAGYGVTVKDGLPTNLAGYQTIWFIGIHPLSTADQKKLVGFVKNGGGLFLTGERVCCEASNRADERIIDQLTTIRPTRVGDGADVDPQYIASNTVNTNAIDGVGQIPNRLSTWQPSAPGVLSGLATRNALTFAYQGGAPVVTGEVWDGSEVAGGIGRLAILMDVNWLESQYWDAASARAMALNLQRFLHGGDTRVQPLGDTYVALGDSYSAGEGNPKFEPDTDKDNGDSCHRSEEPNGAYALMVEKKLGNPSFAFVACSGSTIGNIWSGTSDPPQGNTQDPEPLQITSLSSAARVVTLTIGGNDVGFAKVLSTCILHATECSADRLNSAPPVLRNLEREIAKLEGKLEKTYRAIKSAAYNANIYVLGYPDIFPPTAPTADSCFYDTFLEHTSIEWLIERQAQLDEAIKDAARKSKVTWIDPNSGSHSFGGHDICSKHSWFIRPENSSPTHYSFHPTTKGQEELAETLIANGIKKSLVAGAAETSSSVPELGFAPAPSAPRNAIPADDPEDASILGTVTAAGGAALAGVQVYVVTSGGSFVAEDETGADGGYSIPELAAGAYTVEFYADREDYEPQWWDGKDSEAEADEIELSEGQSAVHIDATLQPDATISGKVTAAGGGPLAGASVYARSTEGGPSRIAETDADGTYTITGLNAGGYTIQFSDQSGPSYETQWYHGKPSEGEAEVVTLGHGEARSHIDAALVPDATVSGTVKAAGGAPLAGIGVYAEGTEGNGSGYASSGADGTYTITGLPTGHYTVEFYAGGTRYETQWYDDEPTEAAADQIALAASENATGIDATLQPDATISGKVTATGGGALAGVEIFVEKRGGGTFESATTAQAGEYTVEGLPAGEYTVEFYAGSLDYENQWYDDEPTEGQADPLTLTTGEAQTGVDASLRPDATVSGTVTSGVGEAVPGVTVVAQSPVSGTSGSAVTGADGGYTIERLPAGEYTVRFEPNGLHYAERWYDEEESEEEATRLTLSSGEVKAGVDANLPRTASAIRGTVTDGHGQPLAGLEVVVTEGEGGIVGTATTAADGTYIVDGLQAGSYQVEFEPGGADLLPQFYDGAGLASAATPVPVPSDSVVGHIDAVMKPGATITGTVTAEGAAPLGEVDVSVYDESGAFLQAVATESDGTYAISGLAPGTDTVSFEPTGSHYVGQFYDQAAESGDATRIPLGSGATVEGIDARLVEGATVEGTVTAAGGAALEGVEVHLQPTGGGVGGETITDSEGNYAVTGLLPGGYTVQFVPTDGNYAGLYYDGKLDAAEADVITLAGGATRAGVDASLSPGGTIAGTVTDGQTHAPAPGVQISVEAAEGGGAPLTTTTGEDGTYSVAGLAPGKYLVGFEPAEAQYLGQYYDEAEDAGSANQVTVGAGASVEGIDAALAESATISGDVSSARTGSPIAGAEVSVRSTGGGVARTATSGEDGSYSVTGLPAGSYAVEFSAEGEGYLSQFYDDEPSVESAQTLTITAGQSIGGVDAALAGGASVAGTVTAAGGGGPIEGVEVFAEAIEGGADGVATTGADGHYSIVGLMPGKYVVQFEPIGSNYLGQFYDGVSAAAEAEPLTLAGEASRGGVDAALASGATISGTVTESGTEAPLPGIEVVAYTSACDHGGGTAMTDEGGHYEIRGIAAGTYHLVFNPAGGSYESEPYATEIPLVTNAHEVGVDGSLAGTVAEGAPFNLACAAALYPIEISPPSISGTTTVGETLAEAHGTWSNDPTDFEYRWERCHASVAHCEAIAEATSQSYLLGLSDIGSLIRVRETASNAEGPGSPAESLPTAVVQAAVGPPAPVQSPPAPPTGAPSTGATAPKPPPKKVCKKPKRLSHGQCVKKAKRRRHRKHR